MENGINIKNTWYYYLPEGKTLFLDISDILNKRYSTGPINNIDSIIEDIFKR
jgi:hypothetical protein